MAHPPGEASMSQSPKPTSLLLHCLPLVPSRRSQEARNRIIGAIGLVQQEITELTRLGGEANLDGDNVFILALVLSLSGMHEEADLLIENFCVAQWAFMTDDQLVAATPKELERRTVSHINAVWVRQFRRGH